MQKCKRCGIMIRNPQRRCPLCQGPLEGEMNPEDRMFPDLKYNTSRFMLVMKIFTFVCVAICVGAAAINWIGGFSVFWAGYVMAGVLCLWIITIVGVGKRRNLLKNTMWQMVILWCVFLFWDRATGWYGWSLDYGIPGVWIVTLVVLGTLIRILKVPVRHYMVYLILAFLGSLVPAFLLASSLVKCRIPSVICVAAGVLLLCGLAIFKGRELAEELKKNAHI